MPFGQEKNIGDGLAGRVVFSLLNSHSTYAVYGGPEPTPATATRPQRCWLLAQTAVERKQHGLRALDGWRLGRGRVRLFILVNKRFIFVMLEA